MKMQTRDGVADNISWIAEKFPNCVTEKIDAATGEVKLAVDFDMLRQELSSEIVEGKDERYQFVWPDKKKAILLANAPINATLRPCEEESEDFANTQNLYIEGDNLDVLKCLKETYLGKVKMIYIDPPYNTGNDFVYNDDFAESVEDYLANSGQYDEQGNRLVANTDSNGRFHTDWLNMMYPRLKTARDLMSDDGIILISIDDNEINNLEKVCNDVFGESNKIASLITINNPRGRQSDTFFATVHEYLLCYAKNKSRADINGMPLTDEQKAEYSEKDENGNYRLLGLRQRGVASLREDRPDMFFPIYVNPNNLEVSLEEHEGWEIVIPKKSDGREGRWMWGKTKCKNEIYRLVPRLITRRNEYDIFVKDYLEKGDKERTRKFKSLLDEKSFNNQNGTQEVKALLEGDYMSFPKSMEYIKTVCLIASNKNSIVLDFFSGSATTAHAVMQLNAEDGGHRKFIMVQVPEITYEGEKEKIKDEEGNEIERYIIDPETKLPKVKKKSEALKAGFPTICEIGKERIRRAAKKIKEETGADIDYGFRVLKLDSSNMEDVYYAPAEVKQEQMSLFAENVKYGRTSKDLLFQTMLELGATLDSKIEETKINDKVIYNVADGYLVACFDTEVSDDVVKAIAQMEPQYAVLRDSSLADDSTATNFDQIFKTYSPTTTCKIL